MKLVIISGRSGSGKSTALQALEDLGLYCIDNLPATLLPDLIKHMLDGSTSMSQIAVCIDARNLSNNLEQLPDILNQLQSISDLTVELLYLDASQETLIQRYSSTRRRHPMSDIISNLPDAIEYEYKLLEPIAEMADIRIDTTRLSLYELRDTIKIRVMQRSDQTISLQFESFGFKHGVPMDVDLMFDMRILPNPYWIPELRQHTGQEKPVIEFLSKDADVQKMIQDIQSYLEAWLPKFSQNNRSYVTVGIGCTGGQHRSVFVAEQLTQHFKKLMSNVYVRHRELH